MGMGKKRKQDHDSSSSDAKRCRSCHCHNGDASRPSDEGFSLRDAVNELKDVIQVKARTKEKFKREIEKLKEKRKKDNNKHEEDLRMLKEDLIRIFKEDQQELKLQIQEMRKDGCAQVNHHEASPSQRSQLSQSTRFRLKIENSVKKTIYKKENVETEDGGGCIKVVMYDGDNRIASDHPLASVRVDLVVIKGGFNESKPTPVSWSKEEFEKNIVQPREGIKRLVENGTFDLIDGSCAHEGAIIMDNSQQREVKLGVMIAVPTETRVLEGVSNPFKVQEGKTKKTEPNKKCKKSYAPVPTGNLAVPTSTNATQHGQGPVSTDVQHCFPAPVIQDVLQKAVSLPRNFQDHGNNTEFLMDGSPEDNRAATVPLMVEGNGQALNGNGQQSCQQILTQISWLPTSTHSMQHGQDCSLPSTSVQNPLQAAGYCPVNQSLLGCEQDQYTSFLDASSQLAFQDLSAYASLNDIYQWTSTHPELGLPSQSIGEISVEDVPNFNVRTQIQDTYGSFRCGQVLLQWDNPQVELKKHWNFLDQLMPLYSIQSRVYRESFPSTRLMDKAHKLLASIPSSDSVLKVITSLTSRATQTPQRRPPVKKQRNAKYQLRFVNRVCNDYYTREQIKSEDGNLLKVALYDENNLVVTSGPLSSASVEVVLLHGDFNAEGQDYWTSEFSACLVHPHCVKEPPALGGDRVFTLADGEADVGNVYFKTSFHARTGKFIMGVEIKNVREESVQEGTTSPFLVRVRQGEESSCHQNTPFKLFGARIGSGGASSALHDQSSQVRNVLGVSMAKDHDSMLRMASYRPPQPSRQGVEWSFPSTDRSRRVECFKKWRMEHQYPPPILFGSYNPLFSTEKNEDSDDSASTAAEPSTVLSLRG